MNPPRSNTVQPSFRLVMRMEPECSFAAIREAALIARQWLVEQDIPESGVAGWELALVEAGNNAVEHAPEAARKLPVEIELSCGEFDVEARVTDHTAGFDFPEEIELPDFESEGSRGLFLIKSLTDHVEYRRGHGSNTLVLRQQRGGAAKLELPNAMGLQRRLSESESALTEMAEELSSSYESLVAMFRYSAELGANTELPDFAKRLLRDLAQITTADAVVLRLVGEGGGLELFSTLPEGLGAQLPPLNPAHPQASVELEAVQTREDVWFGSERPLDRNDPLCAIPSLRLGLAHAFGLNHQILGTITLARCGAETPFRSAQVNLLHSFVDFLGIQIVNTRLLKERTQAHITRRELEIAASIQRSLLPVSLPPCAPFEVAASCISAREVGGDYYDAIKVGDQGVLLVIADVMGKGVPAALFAALLRSTVRSMPSLFTEPAALLTAANRTLCDDLARVDMFVTAKVVFVDTKRAQVSSASAGHGPLLVWRPGIPGARPADDAGLPLGIDSSFDYAQTTTEMPVGSVALLYTDGVSESRDPAGELFGEERLTGLLSRCPGDEVTANALCRSLLTHLENFRAGTPLTDDQTILLLRHTP